MRAAVRLRTHAIGNYARPQTDAPRTMFVLALIAAAGVTLPWAHGYGWSKRGWSYEQGLITLGAAICVICLSALRADGYIGRRWYEALALPCALIGLGATFWFYSDVVGSIDTSPHAWGLFSLFAIVRVVGAIGLYVSMAGFLGQVGVVGWHLDFVVQRRIRAALRSPWTVAALAGVTALGVSRPWAEFLTWEGASRSVEAGWSINEGLIALVAAIAAAVVCGLRLSGRIRVVPYAALGLVCAVVGFAAVVWFHRSVGGGLDPTAYPLLVAWLNAPRMETGLRESLSATGFIGMMAVLIWQLWQGSRRTA